MILVSYQHLLFSLYAVKVLRPTDSERWAAQLIAYYTTALPEGSMVAGLKFFAAFYLDASGMPIHHSDLGHA
jgi:hypothetical protein